MTYSPYLLFHQTPETVRRIGARGGKAQARNRRERLGRSPIVLIPSTPPLLPRQETTAEAIAELDARFPWLRGAERRDSGRRFRPDHAA